MTIRRPRRAALAAGSARLVESDRGEPMAHEQQQAFCRRCNRHTLHVRDTRDVSHILWLLLTILTCGFFLIVWLIDVVANEILPSRIPFLCSQCGQAQATLPAQRATELDRSRARISTATDRLERARRAHERDIWRAQRRRLWAWLVGIPDAIERSVVRVIGEENEILAPFLGGIVRALIWAIPLTILAAGALALLAYLT